MDQPQRFQLDLTDYLAARQTGAAKVVKLNGVAHYSEKRFNEKTGVPAPVLIGIDRERVAADIEAKKAEVALLEQLLADIDAAVEVLAK